MAKAPSGKIPPKYKGREGTEQWAHRHQGNGANMAREVGVSRQAIDVHCKARGVDLNQIKAEYTEVIKEQKSLARAIKKQHDALTRLAETGGGSRVLLFSTEYFERLGDIFYEETAQARKEAGIKLSRQDCVRYLKDKYKQLLHNGINQGFCPLMTPMDLMVTKIKAGFDAATLKAYFAGKVGRAAGEEGAKDLSRLDHTKTKSLLNCASQDQAENRAEAQHRTHKCKGLSLDRALAAEHKAKQDAVYREELIAQAIESIGDKAWQALENHHATLGMTRYWLAAIVQYRPYAEKFSIVEYDFVPADGRIVLQHNVAANRLDSINADLAGAIDTNRKIKYRQLRDNPDLAKMELGASLAVWMLYAKSKGYTAGSRFWYALRDTIVFLSHHRDQLPPELDSICGQFLALKEGALDKACPSTALTGLIVDGAWEAMPLPICIVSPTIADSIPNTAAAADLYDPEDDWESEDDCDVISDTERREKIVTLQNELIQRWKTQNIALMAQRMSIQNALFKVTDLVGRFTSPGGSR